MGFTESEGYLLQLARSSFLRFWSWPNLFRDQKAGGVDGKEICDLLVVFGDDVLIFSDKLCAFPDSGDIRLDWCRWYRRAVEKSAIQALGAKRWIENYPDRIFTDASCTHRLPLDMPKESARYHLIVVAHGSGQRCAEFYSDSESLIINTRIAGASHYEPTNLAEPFVIGRVFSNGPFVHVLDDSALDTLLSYLNTAGDFIEYLKAREEFLQRQVVVCVGEEQLLGVYMSNFEEGRRHFRLSESLQNIYIDTGHWEHFIASPEYKAKLAADDVSYLWDGLIDSISDSVLSEKYYFDQENSTNQLEQCLRIMASENRAKRRLLSRSFKEILARADEIKLAVRVVAGKEPSSDDVAYVLLALDHPPEIDEHRYRCSRLDWLEMYCMVAKLCVPTACKIVGIASESMRHKGYRSEDVILPDGENWSQESEALAREMQHEHKLLVDVRRTDFLEKEFPLVDEGSRDDSRIICYCGSGKLYGDCHGDR